MDKILKKVEIGKFITTALKSILKLVKLQSFVANEFFHLNVFQNSAIMQSVHSFRQKHRMGSLEHSNSNVRP